MQAHRQAPADRSRRGAVLLEVLLALALFVFAATVITSSLNTSVERVTRLRAQLHALDLAVTVLSEVKLGILPMESAGPEPFEAPFDHWTWEVEAAPDTYGSETVAALQLVTVIVRNDQNTAVQRLTEILAPSPATGGLDSFGGTAIGSTSAAPAAGNDLSVP